MTDVFRFQSGDQPLLISVPHDGREVPEDIRARMSEAGLAVPDTDWYVAELYEFAAELGATMLIANYSRYVVDLNRSADDEILYPGQAVTGLCPEQTFAGEDIYTSGGVDAEEKAARVEAYWRPYHARIRKTLDAMREQYGYALLWDAHSIPSCVPRLFDGELPALNLGSYDSRSCRKSIESAVARVADASPYSNVVNGRFKGGYITRHYGDPEGDIHALQLEIAQRAYMNEEHGNFDEAKAERLRATLSQMLRNFIAAARK
ncbi:MAG TPA: N-formylglutamate deformylase [Woeseiaceae bacterium]|nr:N-formylglutamate deformylase [Woeseiaceae bacterium]